jgi:hypothetical protein
MSTEAGTHVFSWVAQCEHAWPSAQDENFFASFFFSEKRKSGVGDAPQVDHLVQKEQPQKSGLRYTATRHGSAGSPHRSVSDDSSRTKNPEQGVAKNPPTTTGDTFDKLSDRRQEAANSTNNLWWPQIQTTWVDSEGDFPPPQKPQFLAR